MHLTTCRVIHRSNKNKKRTIYSLLINVRFDVFFIFLVSLLLSIVTSIVFLPTINCKINSSLKGVYLSISKLHSILAVANLRTHNNISEICYSGQISLQSAAVFYYYY